MYVCLSLCVHVMCVGVTYLFFTLNYVYVCLPLRVRHACTSDRRECRVMELELQAIVTSHMGARNWTQVLEKSSKCT